MSNTLRYAFSEFQILRGTRADAGVDVNDPDRVFMVEHYADEIMALCEKFGESGQSGGSAPHVAAQIAFAVKRLLMHQPITPLTGEEDEWIDQSEASGGEPLWQNRRCSSVFKKADGPAYYLDAIKWFVSETGETHDGDAVTAAMQPFNESLKKHSAIQNIKFPFTPKTFFVDVTAPATANGIMYIRKRGQLNRALQYFRK